MTKENKHKRIGERIVDLEDAINNISISLKEINNRLNTSEQKSEDIPVSKTISSISEISSSSPSIDRYPVPMEYREIIDTILNHSFGVSIQPMTDQPAFTLNIIVPDKYSNMSKRQKEMYKTDIRSKVINYAEGSNGVRAYSELVANNLGPEIRAMIITDRANLQ